MDKNELDQYPQKDRLQAETRPRIYCVCFRFYWPSINPLKLYKYVTQNPHASKAIIIWSWIPAAPSLGET